MVWIALRVESKVPVVIMGETGCGKTSLIRHLARLLSVDFRCLNIHAGTSSREIVHFLRLCAQQSSDEKPVWAFLDEVNTCEHMGLITEVLCHHRALGESLPDSLTLLAACNPYRKKPELSGHEQAAQQALTLSDSSQRRSHSELVYSVQELPEALYDYLYDFGFLGEPEEESYVRSMVNQKFHTLPQYLAYWPGCLTELIVASQRFTAQNQPACLLSLRDVKRCVELVYWFKDHLKYRTEARRWDGARNAAATSDVNSEMFLRAVLNGLAVSYHCRLPTRKLRFDYRRLIAEILAERRVQLPQKGGWTRNGWTPWEPESVVNWLLKNETMPLLEAIHLQHASSLALLDGPRNAKLTLQALKSQGDASVHGAHAPSWDDSSDLAADSAIFTREDFARTPSSNTHRLKPQAPKILKA
ncbi:rnf213a [Symbiodinium sp. KB8]|nr:rnf213a [Symbiodinium sp. KB8]